MNSKQFIFPFGGKGKLRDFKTTHTDGFNSKQEAREYLDKGVEKLAELQNVLYASDRYAMLLIFQAMDAAGKDSTIKHVMSGINPQGCQVFSFKAPSAEELDHGYLWRCMKAMPERGRIGIFNRSYYEEVLVVKVHPKILISQRLPDLDLDHLDGLWKSRYEEIRNLENYLINNGIIVLKFFLHVSKEEQKKRFLERIDNPSKNWKFSMNDINERAYWDEYMKAYEDALRHTSTERAPWYVIPADKKWYTRAVVCDIIISRLESLDLQYPRLSEEQMKGLIQAKEVLLAE